MNFKSLIALLAGVGVLVVPPDHASVATPADADTLRSHTPVHHYTSNPTQLAFAFGQRGGFAPQGFPEGRVSVLNNGTVTVRGNIRLASPEAQLDNAELTAILTLADAIGFFSMPKGYGCSHGNPDAPTTFIRIHATSGTKTVTYVPGCNRLRYEELYSTMSALVDVEAP